LCQLPSNLSNPDLARLLEVMNEYEIPAIVPEIVKREWIFFHQQAARKKYDEMISCSKYLGQYRPKAFSIERVTAKELAADVERTLSERFKAAGFIELPTVSIELPELIHLAIHQVKPFTDGDRGFRDMLIALTIAERAKVMSGHRIFIVAHDDIFSAPEVKGWWEDVGVLPTVVKTLRDAVTQLVAAMSEAGQKILENEARAIKAFLDTRKTEIFERLKTADVSAEFIRTGGPSAAFPAFYGTLETVRRVEPLEITAASRGHVLGEFVKKDGRVPITFEVKVAFDITIGGTVVRLSDLLSAREAGPRIRLSGERIPDPDSPLFWQQPVPTSDITITRTITVEAWVTEKPGGGYSDLTIEKVSTA
jgi:hypothetical protein